MINNQHVINVPIH